MGDVLSFERHLERARVVRCRSGPGFRLVLSLTTKRGTPVVETLVQTFSTVLEARQFALEALGIIATAVRVQQGIDGQPESIGRNVCSITSKVQGS